MNKYFCFGITFSLFSTYAYSQTIEIDSPKPGWRSSTKTGEFRQEVNYPASSVSTQIDQPETAVVKGRILDSKKIPSGDASKPYTLVVNGVAMPLRIDGDQFSRPYMFGPGSNNVEVRSPSGESKSQVQFFESNSNVTKPKLSVVLSWDTNNTDLDLHVISPDGQHCWYGQRSTENGGALDVDVTSGYGPEIFSSTSPLKGTYLVYVNYYGSGSSSDMTLTQISIITNQNSVDEKLETLTVPMRRAGDLTLVKSFNL